MKEKKNLKAPMKWQKKLFTLMFLVNSGIALSQNTADTLTACDSLKRDYVHTILINENLKQEILRRDTIIKMYSDDAMRYITEIKKAEEENKRLRKEARRRWIFAGAGLSIGYISAILLQ